jgi:hypothetical protein
MVTMRRSYVRTRAGDTVEARAMVTPQDTLSVEARKQAQREADARALHDGTKTAAELRRANEHFAELAKDAVLRMTDPRSLA